MQTYVQQNRCMSWGFVVKCVEDQVSRSGWDPGSRRKKPPQSRFCSNVEPIGGASFLLGLKSVFTVTLVTLNHCRSLECTDRKEENKECEAGCLLSSVGGWTQYSAWDELTQNMNKNNWSHNQTHTSNKRWKSAVISETHQVLMLLKCHNLLINDEYVMDIDTADKCISMKEKRTRTHTHTHTRCLLRNRSDLSHRFLDDVLECFLDTLQSFVKQKEFLKSLSLPDTLMVDAEFACLLQSCLIFHWCWEYYL